MSKRRKYTVQLELTEAQQELLDRIALEEGCSSTEFVRMVVQKSVTEFLNAEARMATVGQ